MVLHLGLLSPTTKWSVVRVGMGPIGFGSAGKALGVASPNGGTAPQHGGTAHNDRIDKWVQKAQSTKGVDNIRKNQQQVDINGNRVEPTGQICSMTIMVSTII
ncbi:MAG: hypothetical protein IPJ13_23815 [Saprospiraceae bacterium]|nr:hypothetical protein [Saprospiraceae bacterium]